MIKICLLVLFLGFSLNSEAQRRCFNLFTSADAGTAAYYAEVVDILNQRYNQFLFTESLTEKSAPSLNEKNWSERTQARFQASKLRRLLKDLKTVQGWDHYDMENFAKKLEGLTFLTDPSVTQKMTQKEKTMYHQARHSLLTLGLENFLFQNSKTSVSTKRKVFQWIMTPFKDIYSRWTYALLYMPKLNGAILPFDLAAKIAWEGLEKNRDLLKPYESHALFKSYFNVLSSVYNWGLVSAIFIALPAYGYLTFSHMEEQGNQQVQTLFAPLVEHSEQMAQRDYHQVAHEKKLSYFRDEFRSRMHREPNAEEIEMVKKMMGS